ncbi:MAG: polymerase sigma factor, sigma-70 family protein [Chthonomonadales bacterium]|nr:polymerase sigma factor, sigma-70 family protein [Chthonomonadales bacterium]
MSDQSKIRRFERLVLPHVPAAHNLAWWILRNDQDAEDVAQEACLRAFQHLDRFRGEEARAWLLTIVRNEAYDWLDRNRRRERHVSLEAAHIDLPSETHNPEVLAMRRVDVRLLHEGLENLPLEFREVLVLRELEGFSYREIAAIVAIPLGTVMSRLARGRKRLQEWLYCRGSEDV